MTEKNTMWNSAARSGLVLGCISIVCLMANNFLAKPAGSTGAAVVTGVASTLLWIAKIAVCIILMRRFILSFASETGATRSEARSFGRKTALLSALLYSGFYLAYVLYINPDIFTDALSSVAESGMIPSDQMDLAESMKGKMPRYTFICNLIYCYLFGAVLSLIFSSGVSDNPFDQEKQDQ